MIRRISELEKMIFFSTLFTIMLVVIRYLYTSDAQYLFYPWNLFLATVPVICSRSLKKHKKISVKVLLLLMAWLLFFPNAPYVITDLFHFQERPPIPYWFDLLIVMSGAWNGIALCFLSLMQVEKFLKRFIKIQWLVPAIITLIILCSYGMYLGRYKRYNSWDIVTEPADIMHTMISHIAEPWDHLQAWAFTILFAVLLSLIYFTIKKIPGLLRTEL